MHCHCSSTLHLRQTLLLRLHLLLQAHDFPSLLLTRLLQLPDARLCPLNLLVDELQASIDGGDGVGLVLLEEYRTNQLVDVGGVGEGGEFGGHSAVFCELRFQSLAGGDGGLKVWELCVREANEERCVQADYVRMVKVREWGCYRLEASDTRLIETVP